MVSSNPHFKVTIISNVKQEIRSVELGVCPVQHFHLEQAQRDVHPVQNLLLCTKFRRNRMIFIIVLWKHLHEMAVDMCTSEYHISISYHLYFEKLPV